MIIDGCWTGSLARLDYLRSDFNSAFCTNLTTIFTSQPYIQKYTGTIEGCIDRCGYPNSNPTARAISVRPIFAADPNWQTYVYDCECYDTSWIGTVENDVPCGFGVRHINTKLDGIAAAVRLIWSTDNDVYIKQAILMSL